MSATPTTPKTARNGTSRQVIRSRPGATIASTSSRPSAAPVQRSAVSRVAGMPACSARVETVPFTAKKAAAARVRA